jgi:adenine phosphoribosyltransferase
MTDTKTLLAAINDVPDFPKPGILFKDIGPILKNTEYFSSAIDLMAEKLETADPVIIVGIDARGFLFASALAYKMGVGLAMCRKPGKLPGAVLCQDYQYEYASGTLCIQKDLIEENARVAIIDDVLATGSTARACAELLDQARVHVVSIGFFLEIAALDGSAQLEKYDSWSLLSC